MGLELTRSTPMSDQNLVFVSYSHADVRWLERLRLHLKPLERLGTISLWDDTRIKPGTAWRQEIRRALERARVAVLLVSADFLASDFIETDELPSLLKAAEERGTVILPVIVKPCRFEQTEGLAHFQAVNKPSEPLVALRQARREDLFVKLSKRIEDALRTPGTVGKRQSPSGRSIRAPRQPGMSKRTREVRFGPYTVRELESGSIEVEFEGKEVTPTKPALREIAAQMNVGLLNSSGNLRNTRQLGAAIINRIKQFGTR